jgi:hypothetical protein
VGWSAQAKRAFPGAIVNTFWIKIGMGQRRCMNVAWVSRSLSGLGPALPTRTQFPEIVEDSAEVHRTSDGRRRKAVTAPKSMRRVGRIPRRRHPFSFERPGLARKTSPRLLGYRLGVIGPGFCPERGPSRPAGRATRWALLDAWAPKPETNFVIIRSKSSRQADNVCAPKILKGVEGLPLRVLT